MVGNLARALALGALIFIGAVALSMREEKPGGAFDASFGPAFDRGR